VEGEAFADTNPQRGPPSCAVRRSMTAFLLIDFLFGWSLAGKCSTVDNFGKDGNVCRLPAYIKGTVPDAMVRAKQGSNPATGTTRAEWISKPPMPLRAVREKHAQSAGIGKVAGSWAWFRWGPLPSLQHAQICPNNYGLPAMITVNATDSTDGVTVVGRGNLYRGTDGTLYGAVQVRSEPPGCAAAAGDVCAS
jgi:hypothetical protein